MAEAAAPRSHVNNFDLLRLLAASQVMYMHAVFHLAPPHGPVFRALNWLAAFFPGVPVFFFMSGFLIAMSFSRNSNLANYTRNRVLRIYPALWGCLLVSLAVVTAVGYWPLSGVTLKALGIWLLAQVTIGQFYNPEFLRGFGVGVLNGSLWTITVELQFYVVLPCILLAISRLSLAGKTIALSVLIGVGLACEIVLLRSIATLGEDIRVKLFGVTLLPYLHMFLVGVVAQLHFHRIRAWMTGRALFWIALYVAVVIAFDRLLGVRGSAVHHNFLVIVLLYAAVLSTAFSAPRLSSMLLGSNDISYGTYIYHMIAVNLLIVIGWTGRPWHIVAVFVLTLTAAWLSWRLIEKPALQLKRWALRPVGAVHG